MQGGLVVCPDRNPASGGPSSEKQAFFSLLGGLGLRPLPGKSLVSWDHVRGEALCQVRRGHHYPPLGSDLCTGAQGWVLVDSEPGRRTILEGQAEERRQSASKVKNRVKDLAGRGLRISRENRVETFRSLKTKHLCSWW